MKKLTKRNEKEWEKALTIANDHGFLDKKLIKELAIKVYNNTLKEMGNYNK